MVKRSISFSILLLFIAAVIIKAEDPVFKIRKPKKAVLHEMKLTEGTIDSVINYGETFIGKPYRYKGPSAWRMDCSGFLSHIFSKYGIDLPHSVGGIAEYTNLVDGSEIKRGDLLFFKGRNSRRPRLGHISIVVEVNENEIKMLHSCSRGIRIDEFPQMEYYQKRFVKAGRILFKDDDTTSTFDSTAISKNLLSAAKDTSVFDNSIIVVGDMMLGTNYPSKEFLPPNDGKNLLEPVKNILQNADVTIGNLEGVLLTGDAEAKTCKNPEYCYVFKSPDYYVNYFKDAGFDILSLANNHVGDFGETGKKNTVRVLKEAGIKFAGLTEYPYTIFEKNGIKYGFCAFAPNGGTVSINDIPKAKEIVSYLDSTCNIVIVSFHGGAEGKSNTHITRKNENYLGENRGNPYLFARAVIDAGADIVFGHGPHVTRAIDLYKDRFIAYSLGNFATYGKFNLTGISGIAPIIKIHVSNNGEFLYANIFSITQQGEGGPVIDNKNKVLKEIKNLTRTDIPESQLLINNDGLVKKKK